MSYEFTLTDKTLMLRAARFLNAEAAVLEASHGPVWVATQEGIVAKKQFDRLLRDARDMKTLVRRLEALHPPVAAPKVPAGGHIPPDEDVASDVVM